MGRASGDTSLAILLCSEREVVLGRGPKPTPGVPARRDGGLRVNPVLGSIFFETARDDDIVLASERDR